MNMRVRLIDILLGIAAFMYILGIHYWSKDIEAMVIIIMVAVRAIGEFEENWWPCIKAISKRSHE